MATCVAGAQYGGGSDLFYSQFELHTRQQKINQIVLLEVTTITQTHLSYYLINHLF